MKQILQDILEILKTVGERQWIPVFENFILGMEISKSKELKKNIRMIYGGVGSFNDLVLYQNGQLCHKENTMLDELRRKLFKRITE
ncbi:hypothetical protein FGM00_07105 [Aggregatimonas sangjinii]|uniref:DUF6966 domain-containing protein n=1 Tax=Aggregatimonas sangjinii TaxID=2583587 RepID=A0A5B7SSA0_9FLAO|nr:hypothetical protein [Aggregatimonas sangjinii]QCW99877.1 hypothetical protein FGM00_07105 [Aggregatimonas sangjinii]